MLLWGTSQNYGNLLGGVKADSIVKSTLGFSLLRESISASLGAWRLCSIATKILKTLVKLNFQLQGRQLKLTRSSNRLTEVLVDNSKVQGTIPDHPRQTAGDTALSLRLHSALMAPTESSLYTRLKNHDRCTLE